MAYEEIVLCPINGNDCPSSPNRDQCKEIAKIDDTHSHMEVFYLLFSIIFFVKK